MSRVSCFLCVERAKRAIQEHVTQRQTPPRDPFTPRAWAGALPNCIFHIVTTMWRTLSSAKARKPKETKKNPDVPEVGSRSHLSNRNASRLPLRLNAENYWQWSGFSFMPTPFVHPQRHAHFRGLTARLFLFLFLFLTTSIALQSLHNTLSFNPFPPMSDSGLTDVERRIAAKLKRLWEPDIHRYGPTG